MFTNNLVLAAILTLTATLAATLSAVVGASIIWIWQMRSDNRRLARQLEESDAWVERWQELAEEACIEAEERQATIDRMKRQHETLQGLHAQRTRQLLALSSPLVLRNVEWRRSTK